VVPPHAAGKRVRALGREPGEDRKAEIRANQVELARRPFRVVRWPSDQWPEDGGTVAGGGVAAGGRNVKWGRC
jgi:hypothetical protein